MIIRGILDNSLNGQLCIRGFAPIRELERISKADYSYQRNPIEDREDIIEFLETQAYLFFPEIILSYKVKHNFDDKKNQEPPLQKISSGKNYTSSQDDTIFKVKTVDYKSTLDANHNSSIKILEIDLNDTILNDAINKNEHPFQRIDGNHRLEAARTTDTPKVNKMAAPFCILLGEEFYANNILQANEATDVFNKSVKIFFHNINTKTVQLTSEENLRVIIDDKFNFPDAELEIVLGIQAVKTRELIDTVNPEIFTGIEHILSKQYRTYYVDVFKRLLEKGIAENEIVAAVLESLKAIDLLYSENDKLKANSSFGLLTAFLYYHVEGNKAKYNFFKDWVLKNHIFEIQEIKAESIIKIFDKIAEQNIKIFVAMPFFSEAEVVSYNNTYEKIITEIKEENPHLNIEQPINIMQHDGKTFNILTDLLNRIKDCSIFIADVSEANVNVIYELGFARSLERPSILVCREADFDKVPFDIEHDKRLKYNPLAHSTLEEVVKKDIKAILQDNYGFIIKE